MTIGIPRALIFWKGLGGEFWQTFFQELNFKVIVSPSSNREIVNYGVKRTDQESCFAFKVFFGHIAWLEEKVDFIFVPRLKRNEKGLEFCPRFFALPDLVSLNHQVISPWLDFKKEGIEKIGLRLGESLGKEEKEIKKALLISKNELEKKKKEKLRNYKRKINSNAKKVVLVSHPYNLYDDYVNLRIREKLRGLSLEPIYIDEVPNHDYEQEPDLPNWHWEFGQEIMNQVKEILKINLSGAIEISSFQCGCDAVLKEFVEEKFKNNNIPFLYLLIDEHTAEAGLQTRLEAFADTL